MDCPGSDKRYGFHIAAEPASPSERLYVFESPIDLMSHATLAILEHGGQTAWRYDSRLSLAGTNEAALPFFLNQHKTVKELIFCLDNDVPGRVASQVMQRLYPEKGYTTKIELSQRKDYNDDLQAHKRQIKAEKSIKQIHRGVDI